MLRTHGRVLEAFGLRPVLMADPDEALEEAKRRLPSVVVVDLVMPGMSGLEFVTRLRTHYGRSCPPVMLVSANLVQLSAVEKIMFDALFPKPYSIDCFIAWIRRLAHQHSERRKLPSELRLKRARGGSRSSGASDE